MAATEQGKNFTSGEHPSGKGRLTVRNNFRQGGYEIPQGTQRFARVAAPTLLYLLGYALPSGEGSGVLYGLAGGGTIYAAKKAWDRHVVNSTERRLHRQDRQTWMNAWRDQWMLDHDGQEPPKDLWKDVQSRGHILGTPEVK